MVTAILPTMTMPQYSSRSELRPPSRQPNGHHFTPSISSELTITQARYRSQSPPTVPSGSSEKDVTASTSQFAGLVGMFTGLGALLALLIFLPLPTKFQKGGVSRSDSVADSFWVVGAIAIAVALFCFIGLRGLPGEEHNSWRWLIGQSVEDDEYSSPLGEGQDLSVAPSFLSSFRSSLVLGLKDVNIGLGYLGGFVARASSVAISLFIPLFVNAYFIKAGICTPDHGTHTNPGEIKRQCARAYVVAAKLTGISQLVALICAPLFGYLSGHYKYYKPFNIPLIIAAFAGISGYTAFGLLKSPDPAGIDGSAGLYFIVALLGISQIGAIVCSLGQLGRGIQGEAVPHETNAEDDDEDSLISPILPLANGSTPMPATAQRAISGHGTPRRHSAGVVPHESTALLPSHLREISTQDSSRAQLKGSIAGLYSLAGGTGILILTKAGGVMFDNLDVGAPFWLMAGFNVVLLIASVSTGLAGLTRPRPRPQWEEWDGGTVDDERSEHGTKGAGVARGGDG